MIEIQGTGEGLRIVCFVYSEPTHLAVRYGDIFHFCLTNSLGSNVLIFWLENSVSYWVDFNFILTEATSLVFQAPESPEYLYFPAPYIMALGTILFYLVFICIFVPLVVPALFNSSQEEEGYSGMMFHDTYGDYWNSPPNL